jgi:hypothetical protein
MVWLRGVVMQMHAVVGTAIVRRSDVVSTGREGAELFTRLSHSGSGRSFPQP